jgi:hypothetical protein
MSDPSPLSLRALRLMQAQIAAGVHGGKPARFRGPEVDLYLLSVGLKVAGALAGWPWCAADCYYVHKQAETPLEHSYCPRTAGAIHMATLAPSWTRLDGPRPGATGVIDRGQGKGHIVICESLGPLPGQITSCEGDTNAAGSTTGDAAGRHLWEPDTGDRGTILGWFDFGNQPPPIPA